MDSKQFELTIIHPSQDIARDVVRSFNHKNVHACAQTDVRDVPVHNTGFVSPANSLLFMDGGIDAAYSFMFPGIQQRCKEIVKGLDLRTSLGRHYLPVGSAIIAPAGPSTYLVAAPTMFLPHDVSMTQNAYHAMMAALMAFRKLRKIHPEINVLVCPLLCTGYGKMSVDIAIEQMRRAYYDFLESRFPTEVSHMHLDHVFMTKSLDAEQPYNYDNREIKEIDC
jgi:O-acetyl-ADP-ribose deacetylase (regulator of RNase III)